MRTTIKLIGIIALSAIIGLAMTACSNGSGNGGTPYTVYRGYNSGNYELKIIGNAYELTKDGYETNKGTVKEKQGSTYVLQPSNSALVITATVSSEGLVELLGTINWGDGISSTLPGALSPDGVWTGNTGDTNQETNGQGPEAAIYILIVMYDINGADGTVPSPQQVHSGESITLPYDNYFYMDGYTFIGWRDYDTGHIYSAGDYWPDYDIDYYYNQTITLYAVWEPNN